jgi:outer membrane protein TolC
MLNHFNGPKVSLMSLAVFSIINSAHALDLTLDEAIRIGVDSSPVIQLSKAKLDEASGAKTSSMAGFLPRLNVGIQKYVSQKYQTFDLNIMGNNLTSALVMPKSDLQFNFEMPLFNGFRNFNSYKAASENEEAHKKFSTWDEFVLKRNIKLAFYRALAAKELLLVANENIVNLEDHYNHTQSRRKGGIATHFDVLRIEVQLDEAKTKKMESLDQFEIAKKDLSRLLGTPDENYDLIGELPIPVEKNEVTKMTKENINNRKDLEALRNLVNASDFNRKASKSWLVPEIGINAQYDYYNNRNFSWTKSEDYKNAYGVGIFIRWNLFDGGASIGQAAQASAQSQKAQAQLKLEEQSLVLSLENFKRKYQYGFALYTTAVSDIKKSEESVRQAKEGSKNGVRTASEQLDAQLDLFRSRAFKVNAEMMAAEALINLELTTGKEF